MTSTPGGPEFPRLAAEVVPSERHRRARAGVLGGQPATETDFDPCWAGAPPAGAPATVATVLDALATVYPELERRIRDEQGQMRPHVNAFVGADNVRNRNGTATPIDDDQELTIIPAVSGG